MSQNVFTKNGWVQTSGNVNPQLIDDVNQRINDYENKRFLSRNLFDKNAIVPNSEISGNGIATKSGWYVSDLISVEPRATYYFTKSASGTGVLSYDENKSNPQRIVAIVDNKITVPSGCYYIRFNGLMDDVNNVQMEKGTNPTSYTPYAPSNVELQSEIDATPTEYTIAPSDNVTSSSYFKLLVKGKFAQLIADITYTTNATAYTVDLLGTLPSNTKPFGTTNLNFMGTYNLTDTALKSIIINPNNKTISAQCGQTNQSKRLFINITFLLE